MTVTITLESLITSSTNDEAKARLLARLGAASFPVTDWNDGGVARTMVEMDAEESRMYSETQVEVAKSGFLSTALGDWLTLYAREVYGLTRYAATYSEGKERLTCAPGEGPFTILAGQLWFTDGVRRYWNTTGGTLASGGTLDLTIRAESPGADYNVAIGTITSMLTTLVGVTATNIDNGSGTWATTQGTDEESDPLLKQRCRSRWAVLGIGANSDWYLYWCRNEHPYAAQVTRVLVETDPYGNGNVIVTIAGPDGALSGTVVGVVNSWIQARKPLCTSVTVQSAGNQTIDLTGTIFAFAGFGGTAKAEALAELQTYLRTLSINGTAYLTQLVDALQYNTAKVRNTDLTAPAADVVPTSGFVCVVGTSAGLTVTEV